MVHASGRFLPCELSSTPLVEWWFRRPLGTSSASAGTELELRGVDRRIEIEVRATPMRLTEDDHGVVAVADRDMPVLTADMLRETLERVRR